MRPLRGGSVISLGAIKHGPNARACARRGRYSLNSRGFRRARNPQGMLKNVRILCIGCIPRSRFRGASRGAALCVTSSAQGCGRRTYTSRSRLRSFNRCAARLAPRAERSAWSWTSTLEIRPDLENDEIADWRRRGHRDADARRGARFYPGRWALPHHRDMAPFIPLWNECRRHFGLAGHTYRLRIGTSA